MKTKQWATLSVGGKVALVLTGALQVGLLAGTLWDIAHRSSAEVRGDRRMWAGLAFINWFGPLAYFTIGRKEGLMTLAKRYCPIRRSERTSGDEMDTGRA